MLVGPTFVPKLPVNETISCQIVSRLLPRREYRFKLNGFRMIRAFAPFQNLLYAAEHPAAE
jgi:hypothetical protein